MDDLGGKTPIFGNTHIISQVSVLIIRAVAQSAFWLLLLIASSTLLGHPNDDMLMVYLNWNDNFTYLPWGHSNRVHVFSGSKLEELQKPQVKKHPPYQITPSFIGAKDKRFQQKRPRARLLRTFLPLSASGGQSQLNLTLGGVGGVSVDVVI